VATFRIFSSPKRAPSLQIAELVAVKGAITNGNVDDVEAYFESKYAL
jgi:hypothetical protein